jgi:hypothetical protein
MKKIYVCSLFVGKEFENSYKAMKCAMYVVNNCNAIPICPQVYFPAIGLYRETPDGYCKATSLELLRFCDELWYFGDGVTKDMVDAILLAQELGIPVKHIPAWEEA